MSKMIKITPDCIEECKREFEKALAEMVLSDGKITFSKTFGVLKRRAKLRFTEAAYLKMTQLVMSFDKEVAWHGVAFRNEDRTKDEYFITDIHVYPQEVTGSTVNTDQAKYQEWLMAFDDDVFNNIRMQGHSHVNMATSPSSTDLTHQGKILSMMGDKDFYIFLIWNKRGEKTIKIYDFEKNVQFETEDVDVDIVNPVVGLNEFVENAKKLVTEHKPAPAAKASGYGYGGYGYGGYGYSSYSGYQYPNYKNNGSSAKPAASATGTASKPDSKASATTPVTAKAEAKEEKKQTAKKYKKKKRSRLFDSIFEDAYDEDDDPYSAFGYSK